MAWASLQFDITDPDDKEHFEVASKSKDLWLALFTVEQELIKELPEEDRDAFWRILEEYNITLEELS